MRLTDTEVLLALIPYLQSHPGARVDDVARRFGRTPRWLVKTLWELYVCGLPGDHIGCLIDVDMDLVEQRGEIYLVEADSLEHPVRLSSPEAVAVLAGLASLREAAGSRQRVVVDSAIARTRAALGDRSSLADRVRVTGDAATDPTIDQIEEAIAARHRISVRHHPEGEEPRTRLIDPVAIVFRDGHTYVQGWALDREDWRTFRLDRIDEVAIAGAATDHGVPHRHREWFDDDAATVDLRIAPRATWITEKYPVEVVERGRDAWTVRVRVADPQWLTRLLLRLGDAAVVVSAGDWTQQARARATAALDVYRQLAAPATVEDFG